MGVMKSVSGTRRSGFSSPEVSADTYLTVIVTLPSSFSLDSHRILPKTEVILCYSGLVFLSVISIHCVF